MRRLDLQLIEFSTVVVRELRVVLTLVVAGVYVYVDEVVRVCVVSAPRLVRDVERLAACAFLRELDGPCEELRIDLEPDLGEVVLNDLRPQRRGPAVRLVEDHVAVTGVALRELLRGSDVRLLEREQVCITEAGHAGRQDLVGPLTGEVAALREERTPVDHLVDGLPERDVVLEDAARRWP